MKKWTALIALGLVWLVWTAPFAFAADETTAPAKPVLSTVEFKNAVINEPFSPDANEYTLTLEDPSQTPTLKSYTIDGEADIFVTDVLDETKHKTGVKVTLEYTGGTTVYTFSFANAEAAGDSANNYLASVTCPYGEVYPAINENQTEYTLYIASDLTELKLKAVTEDVGAYCELSPLIELGANQELPISATVIAANGDARTYTFKIKRLNKTCAEVQAAMESPDFETLVTGELFFQKPAFWLTASAVVGGLLLLALFAWIAKRLTVNTQDTQEEPFFAEEEKPAEEAAEKASEEADETAEKADEIAEESAPESEKEPEETAAEETGESKKSDEITDEKSDKNIDEKAKKTEETAATETPEE